MRKSNNKKRRRGKYSLRTAQAARHHAQRRGILLLVVLSLLVLFLLVGTAFITSSDDYRKASKTLAAPYEPAINPLQQRDLLDVALGQVVRDTNNPHSSIRYHSLLRDLYGSDGLLIGPNSPQRVRFVDFDDSDFTDPNGFEFPTGFRSWVQINSEVITKTGNQFFWAAAIFNPNEGILSLQEDYYNGRVFTLLDGPATGRSARVVRYFYDGTNAGSGVGLGLFYLMFTDSDRNFSATELSIQPDHNAVLNGQPFNGTGVGYNTTAAANNPRLNALQSVPEVGGGTVDYSVALMPNANYFDLNSLTNPVDPNNYMFNPSERTLPVVTKDFLTSHRGMTGLGGSDESYDAVDFQNMALAWMPVDPIESVAFGSASLDDMVVPSFHRPALLNYWKANGVHNEPNLLRKVLLRPNWYDHPLFDGSNPEFAVRLQDFVNNPTLARAKLNPLNQMIHGPWDVDNDNDSRRDSMWVDVGLPVMMSPQGRLVKPLAAILCIDLDGRLNINAHGSLETVGSQYLPADPTGLTVANVTTTIPPLTSADLPEGQGYGPAEIDPTDVIGNAMFRRLLGGVQLGDNVYGSLPSSQYQRNIGGRYGVLGLETVPGNAGYDLLSQFKQQGLPQRVAATSNDPNEYLSNYATPPDVMGRYAIGLNSLGQPVYEVVNDPVDLDMNSPYELNLSRLGPSSAGFSSQDGPFSVGELERILRAYDEDAGKLPSRLWDLAGGFIPSNNSPVNISELQEWRNLLTTDSFDLPVPNVTLPEWMHSGPDGNIGTTNDNFANVMGRDTNLTFSDLLEYRVRLAIAQAQSILPAAVDPNDVRPVMRQLLAPELANGTRLDLNRPFGNGRDDNNNGVVDEPGEFIDSNNNGMWDPGEVEAPSMRVDGSRLATAVSNAAISFVTSNTGNFRDNIDRNGDGEIEAWERGDRDDNGSLSHFELVKLHNYRRQLFARHLYVLASTLVDPLPTTATKKIREERARRLAQWAINVADFRDPDSISTAFEYDPQPFNGWLPVDGCLSTEEDPNNRDVTWGCERPELLITETLAWHDRRTEDTQDENVASNDEPEDILIQGNNGQGIGFVSDKVDRTFDQKKRPEGAAFIELYNPWPADTAPDATTHAVDPNGRDLGIDLARTHIDPNNPSTGSPIWRMLVYRGTQWRTNNNLIPGGDYNVRPDAPELADRPYHLAWLRKANGAVRLHNIARPIYQKAERSVYFTNRDPADANARWDRDDGVAFFSSLNVPPVSPGKFMVVAGVDTQQQTAPSDPNAYLVKFGMSQQRGIRLRRGMNPPGAVAVLGFDGNPVQDQATFPMITPNDVNGQGVCSVALIDRAKPNMYYGNNLNNPLGGYRRFTFTEPAGGYPDKVPVHSSQLEPSVNWNPFTQEYSDHIDRPLDERRFFHPASVIYDPDQQVTGQMAKAIIAEVGANGVKAATSLNDGEIRLALPEDDKGLRMIPGFSWVYLQRLRNPTLPWNPEPTYPPSVAGQPGIANPEHDPNAEVNPYMTCDVAGVNVTVFNSGSITVKGEEQYEEPTIVPSTAAEVLAQRASPKRYSNVESMRAFASLQRGRVNNPRRSAHPTISNSLGHFTDDQDLIDNGVGRPVLRDSSTVFSDPNQAQHIPLNLWTPEPIDKLTYWENKSGPNGTGREATNTGHNFEAIPDCTLGYLNEPFRGVTSSSRYVPPRPLPWVAWNNRPYISAAELLQVPAFSPGDLTKTLGHISDPNNPSKPKEAYVGPATTVKPELFLDGPYSHLINFFRTRSTNPDPNGAIYGMNRVLEYVGVPSRFVGTESWLNPVEFGNSDPNSTDDPRYLRQPPFNMASNYRDPGRVNINTIGAGGEREVWSAMFHGSTKYTGDPSDRDVHVAIDDDGFYSVRRGYGVFGDDVKTLDPNSNSPAFIANPFRAAGSGNLVPLALLQRNGTEATLLRSMGVPDPNTGSFFNNSLVPGTQPVGVPLLTSAETEPYLNSFRNSAFRYDPLKRISSFGTTHSNVYAVWITIGFFEVEPAPAWGTVNQNNFGNDINVYNRVYPEGYQFGREVEGNGRQPRRLRMFAIVDRSVPVAFEPGSDHNVERAIRLRRRIE